VKCEGEIHGGEHEDLAFSRVMSGADFDNTMVHKGRSKRSQRFQTDGAANSMICRDFRTNKASKDGAAYISSIVTGL
jgi:hypothetical protein